MIKSLIMPALIALIITFVLMIFHSIKTKKPPLVSESLKLYSSIIAPLVSFVILTDLYKSGNTDVVFLKYQTIFLTSLALSTIYSVVKFFEVFINFIKQ